MSWLDDVSFTLCIPYDVVSIWLDDDIIIDWSIYAIFQISMLDVYCSYDVLVIVV